MKACANCPRPMGMHHPKKGWCPDGAGGFYHGQVYEPAKHECPNCGPDGKVHKETGKARVIKVVSRKGVKAPKYPSVVCQECALANGGRIIPGHVSTVHEGKCDLCGEIKTVTEPRDYGHLKLPGGRA